MNPEFIATNVIELLKPVFTAGVISAASASGQQLAQMLMSRLKGKAADNKTFQHALQNAEQSKGDSQSMEVLKVQLLKEINEDIFLKRDLVRLISNTTIEHKSSSKSRKVSAAKGGIAIGGNMTGDVNITNNNEDN